MKNKKNTYILLLVVLTIWGLVIYRFFSFSGNEVQAENTSGNFRMKPLVIKERDTFTVNVNYRDPFLGKMYLPVAKARISSKKTKNNKPKDALLWPPVVYKGIVSDNKNRKKIFMVIINGQRYLMSEKDTEQEVTLTGGSREFITIKYKGKTDKILLQE